MSFILPSMAWPTGIKAKNRIPASIEKRILRLYKRMSTNNIGALLGISKNTASRVINEAGVSRFKRFAKQSDKMVSLYPQLRAPSIARRFKTTTTTVYGKLKAAGVRCPKWVKPMTDCDHHFFDVIDTPLKAYLLGWILSDGCLFISTRVRKHPSRYLRAGSRKRWPRYELVLSVDARDRAILRVLKRALQAAAKIEVRTKTKKFKDRAPHTSVEARITIRSKILVMSLLKLGVLNRKTGRTTMPTGIPENLLSHFWRGAIEGDGWLFIGKGKRKQFTLGFTGDMPIVKAFQEYCRRYCPTRANIHPNGKKVVRFVVTDWFAYDMAKIIYRDAGENVLKRKSAKFNQAAKFFEGRTRMKRNWLKSE